MLLKKEISAKGHSIEVRLYAEDPYHGYIPSSGTVLDLHWPTGKGIRVESGIECGQKVHTQFDAMLAKLIVTAENRAQALKRLEYALAHTSILGVSTNQFFLQNLLLDKNVQDGKVSTRFIEKWLENNKLTPPEGEPEVFLSLIENSAHSTHGSESFSDQNKGEKAPSPFMYFNKKETRSL